VAAFCFSIGLSSAIVILPPSCFERVKGWIDLGLAGVGLCCHAYKVAEFYSHERSYLWGVGVVSTWYPLMAPAAGDIIAGEVIGWTFDPGRIAATAASESDGSHNLRVDCVADHGLVDGDLVVLAGMNAAAHNKPTRVTRVTATAFTCDDITYASGAGASTGAVIVPATLRAGENAGGLYQSLFRLNATAQASAKLWRFAIFVDALEVDRTMTTRETTGTAGECVCTGTFRVEAWGRVWVGGINETNESDIVVSNCNLNMHRIGC